MSKPSPATVSGLEKYVLTCTDFEECASMLNALCYADVIDCDTYGALMIQLRQRQEASRVHAERKSILARLFG